MTVQLSTNITKLCYKWTGHSKSRQQTAAGTWLQSSPPIQPHTQIIPKVLVEVEARPLRVKLFHTRVELTEGSVHPANFGPYSVLTPPHC